MLRKRCDNCDRMIEVEDSLAGHKVACEACGDINVMPVLGSVSGSASAGSGLDNETLAGASGASGTSGASGDRAVRMGLPPDSGSEQLVMKIHPSMFRARPIRFVSVLVLIFAGITGAVWGGLLGDGSMGRTAALVGGILAFLIGSGWLGVWKVKTLGAAIEITNKRTVLRTGLLSRATSEVVHDNIRNVQVSQSFLQRLFGVGTLGLSSSGQDGIEIQIEDIPNPDRVREVIDVYRPLG